MNDSSELSYPDEIPLGVDGLQYVANRLTRGWGLAGQAAHLQILDGHAFALLPAGTTLEKAKEFDYGSRYNVDEYGWLATRLQTLHQRFGGSSYIVEQHVKRAGDKDRYQGGKVVCGKYVYYFINDSDFNEDEVWEVSETTPPWFLRAFYIRKRLDKDQLRNQNVSDDFFASLLPYIEEIYVGAYDGESLVVWTRE